MDVKRRNPDEKYSQSTVEEFLDPSSGLNGRKNGKGIVEEIAAASRRQQQVDAYAQRHGGDDDINH